MTQNQQLALVLSDSTSDLLSLDDLEQLLSSQSSGDVEGLSELLSS
jgi:hypothetical protein